MNRYIETIILNTDSIYSEMNIQAHQIFHNKQIDKLYRR